MGRLSFARAFNTSAALGGQTQPYTDDHYGYDSMGRILTWWGGYPSAWNVGIYSISAGYDLAGSLQSISYPDGRTVSQKFDAAGHLINVADGSSTYVNSITYNPDGTPQAV